MLANGFQVVLKMLPIQFSSSIMLAFFISDAARSPSKAASERIIRASEKTKIAFLNIVTSRTIKIPIAIAGPTTSPRRSPTPSAAPDAPSEIDEIGVSTATKESSSMEIYHHRQTIRIHHEMLGYDLLRNHQKTEWEYLTSLRHWMFDFFSSVSHIRARVLCKWKKWDRKI